MDRLLLDFGSDGRLAVSLQVSGAQFGERVDPVEWASPLDGAALEDVRWYLEDYLRAPFAVYEERGQKVHSSLKSLGETLFAAVFGQGPGREAYLAARARGLLGEVVVRSKDPTVLGLPWELMRDPFLTSPVALSDVALTRMLPSQTPGSRFEAKGERLRVLMVIARPEGEKDVGYQMVARHVLPLLVGLRGSVELTVLRPPTLRRFEQVVEDASAAGAPFQVVHFDGHGAFTTTPVTAGGGVPDPLRFIAGRRGVLSFESEQGGAEYVSAETVGQVLAAGKVPLVVLNACQSGQVGGELEAGIATRLLTGGAASVVAMAYSVYAVAAAEFMAIFYQRLFAGDTVARAVAAARRHLAVENKRPSAKGRLELADWIIPVHYARADLSFPHLHSEATTAGDGPLAAIMQRVRNAAASPLSAADVGRVDRDLAAFGGVFVGRDGPLYRLDTAARLQHVVVLHGPGGTGKTELAKAFARWWRDTGGVEQPGWIVWHSFEPGIASFGLDGAITAAGLHLVGPDFALLDQEQRREALLQILEQHRVLLIWDNFESAVTMPDHTGATPKLDQTEQAQITAFLDRTRDNATGAVVITSRTPEAWLGPTRRISIGGLNRADAAEYTDLLLAPYPAARAHRDDKAFEELLAWLDGHPLSMRLTLPQLEEASPDRLLDSLRGLTPTSAPRRTSEPADRHHSLAASIAFSIRHLTTGQQDALTVLSLLHGVADEDVLSWFSAHSAAPEQFRGLSLEEWRNTLSRAADLGLLDPIGAGMYRIHPALPAHLAAHWQTRHPDTHEQERAQAAEALLTAHANLGAWLRAQLDGEHAGPAMAILDWQRRNLGAQLGYALEHARWGEAGALARPLDTFWDLRGLTSEARSWVERARALLEGSDGAAPELDTPGGSLWQFLVGTEANRRLDAGLLDEAERTYLTILAAQQRHDTDPRQRANMAVTYHQLGRVAQDRGHLEQAENWYLKSTSIDEEFADRPGAAITYHHLGQLAQDRGHFDQAENWYHKSLTINEELGNRPGAAGIYHQLGILAQHRGYLDQAENWYHKSLTINEELGNRPHVAITYHQLGQLAQDRGHLDQAENWYRKSLTTKEELGTRPGAAITYHQLGILEQDRGHLDQAENWYHKSLTINEELGNRPGAAGIYHQLGRVAQDRGHFDQAENWYHKSLTISEELGNRPGAAITYHQLGILEQHRGHLDQAENWYRKSLTISDELDKRPHAAVTHAQLGRLASERGEPRRALVEAVRCVRLFDQIPHPFTGTGPADLRRRTAELGIDTLAEIWREVTGNALPDAVRTFVTASGPDEQEETTAPTPDSVPTTGRTSRRDDGDPILSDEAAT